MKIWTIRAALAATAMLCFLASAYAQGVSTQPQVLPVRVATTANITLSGTQTIDGVSVVGGDRVLVKNQSTASQNGVYVVAAGAWSRSNDFRQAGQVVQGTQVYVNAGTTQSGQFWILTTSNPISPGSTSLTFVDGPTVSSADVTFIQSGSNAVTTTAQAQMRQSKYAIPGWGLACDGVTDDTTAINNALTDATGYDLVLPANSVCRFSGSITVPSNTCLVGQGRASTVLRKLTANGQSAITASSATSPCVRNLTIDLNHVGYGVFASAINFTTVTDVLVDNVAVLNAGISEAMSIGTSSSSNSIGTGAKSFTTQTGKTFPTGAAIWVYDSSNGANYLEGTVTSYNSGAGALVINATSTGGSGTITSWTIAPPKALGITLNGASGGRVSNSYVSRTHASGGGSYCVLTASSAENSNLLISGNYCVKTSSQFSGHDLQIVNNIADGTAFGAGFASNRDAYTYRNVFASNIARNGVGTDVDATTVSGFEFHGPYSTHVGNVAYNNASAGIVCVSNDSVFSGNVAYDNNTENVNGGIGANWASSSDNCNNTIFSGNLSFNSNGVSTQEYGYYEFEVTPGQLSGISLEGNKFSGATGQTNIVSASTKSRFDTTSLQRNNTWSQWENSGGTATNIMTVDASNITRINSGGGGVAINNDNVGHTLYLNFNNPSPVQVGDGTTATNVAIVKGSVSLGGSTSGTVTIAPQATAGTPTLTLPNASGTLAISASAPIVLSATTGNLTCPSCLTNTPAALTKADDTNVTLTLGGTPATALLQAVSITAGWSGQLAVSRGGTGAGTLTGILKGNGTSAFTAVTGTDNYVPKWSSNSLTGTSLIYDNGSQVCIGTTSCSENLTISGSGSTYMSVVDSSGATAKAVYGVGTGLFGGGAALWTVTNHPIYIGTNNSPTAALLVSTDNSVRAVDTAAATSSTTGALRSGGGIGAAGAIWAGTYTATGVIGVGSLPACGAGITGARMVVNDANATTFASTVAAGGANVVPVMCNGTNWIIGKAPDNDNARSLRRVA